MPDSVVSIDVPTVAPVAHFYDNTYRSYHCTFVFYTIASYGDRPLSQGWGGHTREYLCEVLVVGFVGQYDCVM